MTLKAVRRRVRASKSPSQTKLAAIEVVQAGHCFYLFSMSAANLMSLVEVNRREEGQRDGYQRVVSPSRVRAISRYIIAGGIIPGSIIISIDSGSYDAQAKELTINGAARAGWVIDGQHRLIGAHEASLEGTDIELSVVAFPNVKIEVQVELFVTINREAKGVPASLYLDLLQDLPRRKTEKEMLDERITDIARRLYNDEDSPFFQRLIFTRTARAGEISVVNFARILRPIISRQGGALGPYTQPEQEGAVNNYYKALTTAFPAPHDRGVFFRTVGFGAVWRAFPWMLTAVQARYRSFNVASIVKVFRQIEDFDFEGWLQLGSGTAAELQAGDDLITSLQAAFSDDHTSVALRLT